MRRQIVGVIALGALAVSVMWFSQGLRTVAAEPQRGFGPPVGPPPGVGEEVKLLDQFDKDANKRLDAAERKAAREYMTARGPQRGGGRRGFGGSAFAPSAPGEALQPGRVPTYPATVPFYDPSTLRTLFFTFDSPDWEQDLMVFKDSDVEVPAVLTADGKSYPDVGVQFRGASSFSMVPEGKKHSLNVSVDFVREDQAINGFRSLNLLNSHDDPTFLRTVLFLEIARAFIPAARANFVRVAINGESWGVYASVEQFNKDFVQKWFNTTEGGRWKVPGRPNGRGGLEYLGDDPAAYKRLYEIKSKDDKKSWTALISLTKVLNETPPDKLEAALSPILNIDETLRFLALDNALVNNDGYWVRASDYNLYLDTTGRFHIIPHDINETFANGSGRGGGRGGFGGPGGGRMGGGSAQLDPLVGLHDATRPLRSRLFAVPALRSKYLGYVREIATKWLDWNALAPAAERYRALISDEVRKDTRKLDSYEAFDAGLTTLKRFADERRAFLLGYREP